MGSDDPESQAVAPGGPTPTEERMAPNPQDGRFKRHDWGVEAIAVAMVVATILIGYGLANPRDVALPFALEATVAATSSPASREASRDERIDATRACTPRRGPAGDCAYH